jgi:hypothetical protein
LVLFGGFDDSLEVLRPLGPGEGRWILAVLIQVPEQQLFQVFLGALDAVSQGLLGEDAEEAFDHVHPRSVRCGVVKMHSRML